MNKMAEKIRAARILRGMTQSELGKLLGVSDRTVSKWENGISSPSVENFITLSEVLELPNDHFLEKNTGDPTFFSDRAEGMESLKELYKIGRGPSSSHTIGPERACLIFKEKNKDADRFSVTLYGSLAKTGKGHGTDSVIKKTLFPIHTDILWNCSDRTIPHPNTMDITAFKNGKKTDSARVYSVGGGSIFFEGYDNEKPRKIYAYSQFSEIAAYCKDHSIRLWEYVFEREDTDIRQYLSEIWAVMKESIKNGITDEGILPGGLEIVKKAKMLYNSQHVDESRETRENRIVCSYAFAVGEQNAMGERIVTAPTCGAAGVLPAVMYYYHQKKGFEDHEVIQALATAGLIGNLIKTNASISGAECGCQAEIGSACAMASAALAELHGLSIEKIEYAAEIAIEHHLGLTCDPICGLVQIPCIERNAVAAMRAINAVNLSSFLWNTRRISLDKVIETMRETGKDMHKAYKETSEAGLAKIKI